MHCNLLKLDHIISFPSPSTIFESKKLRTWSFLASVTRRIDETATTFYYRCYGSGRLKVVVIACKWIPKNVNLNYMEIQITKKLRHLSLRGLDLQCDGRVNENVIMAAVSQYSPFVVFLVRVGAHNSN